MYTNLENIAFELFSAGITSTSKMDGTDFKDCLRAYFKDNSYMILDIIECCLKNEFDSDIVKYFESEYRIDLKHSYPYKRMLPKSSVNDCLVSVTQLFIDAVCKFPGKLKDKFVSSFRDEVLESIDNAFDVIINKEYGNSNYRNYEDIEYATYTKTHCMLGSM